MRCNYFDGTRCGTAIFFYTPTDEEKKEFCENREFDICPRFVAHLDVLKAKSS